MTQEVQKKLEDAEQAYRANRLQLENYLEEIDIDQRKFQQYLENVSEQMNRTLQYYEEGQQVDQRQVYRFLEQENEIFVQRTKRIRRQLEDRLEENQAIYSKKLQQYEKEALMAKKEAEKYA